ncbi:MULTISPECIES: hypothetical protein [Photorhabdus]|uniref:Uncharacterized protein n=1 Tax=Photorhabdus thracensis TaxID=230089 RepID=A0A0F7LJH1_9GAMM|nr:hypothetical protein [Photorhabdus thracensis]AKH63229.1 hypothetical protein VY86_07640 [Photorhabdus thracensis]MCC8422684.1 hypothetical protein [Photorhabdus thracensis]
MSRFRTFIHEYIAATKNEIAIDNRLRRAYYNRLPYIPRISKWITMWLRNRVLMHFFFWVGFLLWVFGGALIFYLFDILRCLLLKEKCIVPQELPEQGGINDVSKKYYIVFCSKSVESIQSMYEPFSNITLVTLPWIQFRKLDNINYVSIKKILTFSDYFKAYILSAATLPVFISNPLNIKWILQTYTASKWFCTRLALDKLNGEFITTEHFDRWAVLMDRLCLSKKTNLTLIQHGSLKGLLLPENAHFKLYTRLHSVSELVTYDEIESKIFLNKIIRNRKDREIIKRCMGMKLNTTKIYNDKFSILFIGHSHCEDIQVKIYYSLSELNIIAYYKEHPKAPASRNAKGMDWIFINDSQFFPDVDLVVSYASTLAYEYENIGTKVLFHDLSTISESACLNIVNLIEKEVKNNERK